MRKYLQKLSDIPSERNLRTKSNIKFKHRSYRRSIKIINFLPIYKDGETKELKDSLLIPIYIEIKVRILKRFPNNLEYNSLLLQTDEFIKNTFSTFDWFDELLENIKIFKEFMEN